jgi:hypothetical protein
MLLRFENWEIGTPPIKMRKCEDCIFLDRIECSDNIYYDCTKYNGTLVTEDNLSNYIGCASWKIKKLKIAS